ncbi:MAG TPA: hypothetical protein VNV63_02080, partial [Nitrospiria bacterium]|nr:hypothetical protein [Nitrospiria bacterium]
MSEKKDLRVLDPFCGVGTTLIGSQELSNGINISAVGIERNPFIQFVAQTKVRWPEMDSAIILKIGTEILTKIGTSEGQIPELSSLRTGRCMSRHVAGRLVAIIDSIRSHGRTPNHDALILGVAASAEQLSKIRKDGRALRLVKKNRQLTNKIVQEKWQEIASDVRFFQQIIPRASIPTVILGDGR